jgi:hypothetical protein
MNHTRVRLAISSATTKGVWNISALAGARTRRSLSLDLDHRRKIMKRILGSYLVVGLLISSCHLPAAGAPDPQIATAAALTVQAALNAVTPLATATSNSVVSTATKAISTPTYSQPMASVGDVTNCRKGPGKNYERVTQIMPLESVKIIGFFSPTVVTAPPTGDAPQAASNISWTFSCYSPEKADITLSWNDNAKNESGYRIIRNGEKAAELPANSTYFAETIDLASGKSVQYQVKAYNQSGEANSPIVKIACP